MGDTQDSLPDSQQNKDNDLGDGEILKLRRAWLATLPHEQIVQIIFKLEQHIPEDVKGQIQVWPENIKNVLEKSKSPLPSNDISTTLVTTVPALPTVIAQPTPYPHAPYYPSSTATSAHLTPPPQPPPFHTPYSYYPHYLAPGQQPPYPYFAHQPLPPHPTNASKPLFTSTPLVHQPGNERSTESKPVAGISSGRPRKDVTNEDLPSYEEMIVEGLSTFGGEDGMAPKALFAWIASRYPVQANFRPSASQALQKAYKRGRLEKSSTGGKYRLNPNWEGGATRRSTRRPQTSINAPVHLPSPAPSYSWPQSQYSTFAVPNPGQTPPGQPLSTLQDMGAATGNQVHSPKDIESEDDGEGAVWEAAQNILQALDLSSLIDPELTKSNGCANPSTDGVNTSSSYTPVASTTLPMSSNSSQVQTGSGQSVQNPASTELSSTRDRDALQRNLALLAVQLADFAGSGDDNTDLTSSTTNSTQIMQP